MARLNLEHLRPLVEESLGEGFNHVAQLSSDYESGTLRFDGPREDLYAVYDGEELVAVGGFMHHQFTSDPSVGRVRRVYVKQSHRRNGVGRQLMEAILDGAKNHYEVVVLWTDTERASAFYLSLGFQLDSSHPRVTHLKHLR